MLFGIYVGSISFALLGAITFIVTYTILVPRWRGTSIGRMMQWMSASHVLILSLALYSSLGEKSSSLIIYLISLGILAVGVGSLWQAFEVIRAQRRLRWSSQNSTEGGRVKMNLRVLVDLIPAKQRKYVYAAFAVLSLVYGVWQVSGGDWKQFFASLVGAAVTTLATANTNVQPEGEDGTEDGGES